MTIRDLYPMPCMDECIDLLGDATIYSTLDANSGYWQVEFAEEDHEKTAFMSDHGLFRFISMPFGLKNAPRTFQQAIEVLLMNVKWKFSFVYLDVILIFWRTADKHVDHVRQVLTLS